MIGHYLQLHNYLPPSDFLKALDAALSALPEADCRERIVTHQRKLETAPSAEDILVPYYCAKIYWKRSAFRDLSAFETFITAAFPSGFRSIAVNEAGYFVRTECENPTELFWEIANRLRLSGCAPFKCTFRLVHVGTEEETYSDEP